MPSLLMGRDSVCKCTKLEQGRGVVGVNATLIVVSGELICGYVEALWNRAVSLGNTRHLYHENMSV